MKLGIPKTMYYFLEPKWLYFFEYLKIDVITSCETNLDIINKGSNLISDEACLSLKIFMGHINYLIDKCDYLFVLQIDNFGLYNQTCANHMALYEIVKDKFDNIITATINKNEYKAFYEVGKQLKKKDIKKAYQYACIKYNKDIKRKQLINFNKLRSKKLKILIVSHPYIINDKLLCHDIYNFLNKNNCEIIKSNEFDPKITNKLANKITPNLYFKYSKESIGSIEYAKDKIDGIIFISTFPCGLDSIINELVIRKINIPYLNIILDDLSSQVGIETRLESFLDIVGERNEKNSFSKIS